MLTQKNVKDTLEKISRAVSRGLLLWTDKEFGIYDRVYEWLEEIES